METLGLMSILLATIAAPALAARDPNGPRGLRRMLLFVFVFDALYVAYLTLVHATFFTPHRW